MIQIFLDNRKSYKDHIMLFTRQVNDNALNINHDF